MQGLPALLSDYTFRIVALGCALLGAISGVLGSFAVLRKQSLLGDGVSHAALPGVVAAFLLTGSKNTEILLLGALFTGLLAAGTALAVARRSRVKFDGALALVMSVFFGLGLILLTCAQKLPDANQAGLGRFLYGQASTLLERDIRLILLCGGVLLALVLLFWKEFKLLAFDREFTRILGFDAGKIDLLLTLLTVLAIILGLQAVGVILMSAMLIAPAAAARQWSDRLWVMVLLAAAFGAGCGAAGTAVSSLIPDLPTGPVIVVFVTAIALCSLLFAPRRGVLSRMRRRAHERATLLSERGKGGDVAST